MRSIKATGRAALVVGMVALVSVTGSRMLGAKPQHPIVMAQGSFAKIFTSWGELKGAATSIVIGTAGAQQTVVDSHGRPWTTTAVQVSQTLQGDTTTAQPLLVRQLGGVAGDGRDWQLDGFPLLTSGSRYLLFLTPTLVTPGQFYPVGGPMGTFKVDTDGHVNAYSPEVAQIGVSVPSAPLDQVIQALTAAPTVATTP